MSSTASAHASTSSAEPDALPPATLPIKYRFIGVVIPPHPAHSRRRSQPARAPPKIEGPAASVGKRKHPTTEHDSPPRKKVKKGTPVVCQDGSTLFCDEDRLGKFYEFMFVRHLLFLRAYHGKGGAGQFTPDLETLMDEPILQNRKFCNVFRELDFNTQFLIANVINQGDQSPEEILFRSILFRVFNKPLTWKLICDEIGAALPRDRRREEATWIDTLDNNDDTPRVFPSIRTYNELASTKKSYVAIIPNIKYRYAEEYGNGSEYSLSAACYQMSQSPKEKLKGLRQMQALYLAETLLQLSRKQRKFPSAPVAEEAHQAIKQLAFFGDFLAYQLLLDLNYAPGYDFDVDVWAATGNGSDEALGRIFSKEGLSHHRLEAMQYIHSVQHTQWTRLRSKYPVTPQFALPPSHPSSGKIGISLVEVEHSLCEFNKYSKKQTKEAYKSAGRRPTAILPRKVTEGGDD